VRREIELKKRLRSLHALGEAVGAMKSLSAHHFREARNAVQPSRVYREGVERILEWAGATLRAGQGPAGLLVIGAELGLCGSYNAQVVEASVHRRVGLGPGPTFCVGRRAASFLARRDVALTRSYAAPTSTGGITGLLLQLAEDVLTSYARENLSSFDIVSSRFAGVGAAHPVCVRLLPLETKHPARPRRIRYATQRTFVSAVIREVLYITLYDLLVDALASEHGARLFATQSAEQWLDERTARLHRHLTAIRREAATQEVIEIAAGRRAGRNDSLAGDTTAGRRSRFWA
jgi:F-type H+-transporting ATPase subunit gamma